ncbi:MAG TPA: hypothetical protein VFI31_11340, partial [Pirellulales bacterium]|nr:hypothetical protein [Pirellulales bacterium]
MAGRTARLSRLFSQTAALNGKPVLRLEEIEPRLMLSGVPTPVHAPPIVAQAITLSGASAVTGRTALLSMLGSDAAGESKLTYNWSVASAPAGGSASFSANGTNAAKHETVTFNEAGTYNLAVKIIDTNGLSVTTTKALTVLSTLTSVSITTSAHQTVSTAAPLHLSGTSQSLVAQGLDQFGKVMAAQPSFKWTVVTSPAGATAPGLNANGASAAVIFHSTGSYVLKAASATNANLSGSAALVVDPTATTVTVTPGTASLAQGATQQFSAKAYDQFHNLMATQPGFTWTATGGTVTAGGLFSAGKTAGNFLVTAKTGSVSASSTVTVQSGNTLGLQNAALANLVQGLDADGSISRNDILQILTS